MEYLDLYDKDKKLTGERIIRGKGKPKVPENSYINIVIIFIQNSDGKFLFQVTSKDRAMRLQLQVGMLNQDKRVIVQF